MANLPIVIMTVVLVVIPLGLAVTCRRIITLLCFSAPKVVTPRSVIIAFKLSLIKLLLVEP